MKKQEINRLWVLVNKFRGAFDATELYKIGSIVSHNTPYSIL